jgi:hypothetical protein
MAVRQLKEASMNRLRALIVCAGIALVVVGVAGAANSMSFTDRTSDVKLAPDIASLDVSNDDAGTLTFHVSVANGLPASLPGEELGVAVDLDQNPDTGTLFYGAEVAFTFEGETLHFGRANGNSFVASPAPASLHGTITADGATFSVSAADLGLAPRDGFNVFAISATRLDVDFAPDIRTFNYQQVVGTPQKPLGPDTRAPVDRAFAAKGKHGKVVELDYMAGDGRAVTADTLRIYRGNRVLRTIRYSLGDANPFYVYYAKWRVPRNVRGRLRFCVRSVDAAGNKSNLSCAPLTIR